MCVSPCVQERKSLSRQTSSKLDKAAMAASAAAGRSPRTSRGSAVRSPVTQTDSELTRQEEHEAGAYTRLLFSST